MGNTNSIAAPSIPPQPRIIHVEREELNPSEGERLIVYWFEVVFIHKLTSVDFSSFLLLSLVNKYVAITVKPLIERKYFRLYNLEKWELNRFVWYSPKKLSKVVNTNNFPNNNITHIQLDTNFDQPIANVLPHTLTYLQCGFRFNHPVNGLPSYLTHLSFYYLFNQPIDNLLPNQLTHLKLSFKFNQSVDFLPASLIYLEFSDNFNQSTKMLPRNLSYLCFGKYFGHENLAHHIPNKLTHLEFGEVFPQDLLSLPVSLTHLVLKQETYFLKLFREQRPSVIVTKSNNWKQHIFDI
eukprot:TRINITY_DN5188_c0_g2_i2.p1 TRINITY_DN5188_c0_g2~~TRINITY_DN5188_c0_g2_i2.p1  ORF type:complete len:295 (-),score=47.57 TRINITY_DN5188_c0_g2_i2:700-1584(-)